MYGHHRHGGWGGGPYIQRRVGPPLLGGFGLGGGLMGDLLAGSVGYLVGKNSWQNQQYQQYPTQYQPPYQQSVPPYVPPAQQQYQPAQGNVQDARLAQLNLLDQLRAKGTLTEAEFQAEKQKILNGY